MADYTAYNHLNSFMSIAGNGLAAAGAVQFILNGKLPSGHKPAPHPFQEKHMTNYDNPWGRLIRVSEFMASRADVSYEQEDKIFVTRSLDGIFTFGYAVGDHKIIVNVTNAKEGYKKILQVRRLLRGNQKHVRDAGLVLLPLGGKFLVVQFISDVFDTIAKRPARTQGHLL